MNAQRFDALPEAGDAELDAIKSNHGVVQIVAFSYYLKAPPADLQKKYKELKERPVEGHPLRLHSPPRRLFARGLARQDPLGLGLEVDENGRLAGEDGKNRHRIFALGPVLKGSQIRTYVEGPTRRLSSSREKPRAISRG